MRRSLIVVLLSALPLLAQTDTQPRQGDNHR